MSEVATNAQIINPPKNILQTDFIQHLILKEMWNIFCGLLLKMFLEWREVDFGERM